MSTTIPITRSTRQVMLEASAAQTVFTFNAGPVWDTADLVVQRKISPATRFTTITTGFTLAQTGSPAGATGATCTFSVAPRPTSGDAAVQIRITSRRVHERETDVSRSERIHGPSIEREHDKLTTTLQELRRDVDQQAEELLAELDAAVLGQIPDATLVNAKMANMAEATLKGRASGAGTGAPADLSASQARTIIDPQSGDFVPAGSDAVTRTLRDKLRETEVSVKDFGAVGDGVTDDTLAFTRAFAASDTVHVPPGTYIANVLVPNGGSLIGKHRDLSIIKAKAGTNSTAVTGYEAYTLFGTATYDVARGANRVTIRDLTIDGNRSNVSSSGDGIAIWGWGTTIERVRVVNCRSAGIHTEWTDGNAAMEGHFRDVVIDTTGTHGWLFAGPHDANFDDIMIMDASQNADDTSYGLYIGPNGSGGGANGRFRNIHVWCRGGITNRPAYAVYSSGGNEFTDCHIEGCRKLISLGDRDVVTGGRIYANFGENGAAGLYFRTNFAVVNGVQFDTTEGAANPSGSLAQNPDVYAIDFGTSAANLVTNCMFVGFKSRTPFNFASSGGLNKIVDCIGYANSGGATTFGGTIAANDFIDYAQSGTNIKYVNCTQAVPYAANDAAAAALGVPLYGQYLNSGNNAISVRLT